MEPFIFKKSEYFVINEWEEKFPRLLAGFTSKKGGVSKGAYSSMNLGLHVNDSLQSVRQNREHMGEILGFPLHTWVSAEQTHDIHIEKVVKEDRGRGSLQYEDSFNATDGFFTTDTGLLLTLCYADCVPLYFFHEKSKAIGVAHAGWKGTVNGIAREMVAMYKQEGMDIEGLHAVIGPSICGNCYIVDNRVISLINKNLADYHPKPYTQIEDNQYFLDLKQLNKDILIKSGVLEKNISVTNLCTSCENNDFFSHRRDKGKTGRMMSFIGWKEDF
ncbi:peptidoglycan editing factor PgeF [Bacillus sp. DTU_2020_1000418_1_SI_GHA_SEK_038]|uniref:peptidoglycan editing factor PgeF n=1 Tax=Bacillus sp. DTU_2020_1000418_1_SI_GHA_SEK_038 TaxID=3077585 RepID=UPI0028E2264C|nr:peptidoglycan editing factor PgeF [Bacillus sp. DTU_2020_1000418_1_SI_GHA_SEK_038]WNS77095.1 peptidoglycan editing factor PgeF [Bacillus sp. DTU_2020_1000418_1_SI_GHA_SEK_038]